MTERRDSISVALSVHNEAHRLRPCLESVAWADEIVVVDSGSTDGTDVVAREFTPHVLREPNRLMLNINKNIAIERASSDWVLLLDGDERVTPELRRSVERVLAGNAEAHAGFWISRLTFALGRPVRAFGWWPDDQLRLFRAGAARFPARDHHEMVQLDGTAGKLEGELLHESFLGIWDLVAKANISSESRARHLYASGVRFSLARAIAFPVYYFLYQYVVRRGYREGILGLFIASISAYSNWIQSAKLWSLERHGAAALPEMFVEE